MIAIDFLLKTFYVYLYRYNDRGLLASIYILTISLGLNLQTLLIIATGIYFPGLISKLNPIEFGGLMVANLFLTDKFLRTVYVTKKRKVSPPKFSFIFFVLGPIYHLGSSILFFLSFRYL